MKLQQLLSLVRKAVDEYEMISDGDKIAVGVSGGKDSLALLVALKHLQRFYPKKFELEAISVSLGLPGSDFSDVAALCEELGVTYTIVETDIGHVVFDVRKEPNPCSLCSKMRKGALNGELVRRGCNKVALGHNKGDVIETFFMSLFFEGRLHTFSPVTYLDRKDITQIRPLLYCDEDDISKFITNSGIKILKSPCPADGKTKRAEIRKFIVEQCENYPMLRDKVFTAIRTSKDMKGWL